MLTNTFDDLRAHREHRIERGHRFLENHSDICTASRAHLGVTEAQKIDPVEENLPAADASRWWYEPMIASAVIVLPQPKFTDESQCAACVSEQLMPSTASNSADCHEEADTQVADVEQAHRKPYRGGRICRSKVSRNFTSPTYLQPPRSSIGWSDLTRWRAALPRCRGIADNALHGCSMHHELAHDRARIEPVTQVIAEKVEAHHGEKDEDAGGQHPRGAPETFCAAASIFPQLALGS